VSGGSCSGGGSGELDGIRSDADVAGAAEPFGGLAGAAGGGVEASGCDAGATPDAGGIGTIFFGSSCLGPRGGGRGVSVWIGGMGCAVSCETLGAVLWAAAAAASESNSSAAPGASSERLVMRSP
jgi:hypothetical protein